ncbi:MAG: tyrosine-protein phosphatase [Spirochaetales bacterium]|nr:tyrosine-protein phosphatase [Spirochaetales bacterium]
MSHHNLRDIGGIATQSGQFIKKNHIFRSANTDTLRMKDVRYLESLNIETIVDLRPVSEQKRKKHPPSLPHITTIPIAISEKTKKRLKPYFFKKNSKEKITEIVNSIYREMVHNFKPQVQRIFKLLLHPEKYPFLIHCRAGKDRTGFIISLILLLLNVDKQVIIQDYLSSNDFIIPYARRILIPLKIVTFGFFPSHNLETVLAVQPLYIQTIFETIEKEYNGINGYLETCGISKTEQEQLIAILLDTPAI